MNHIIYRINEVFLVCIISIITTFSLYAQPELNVQLTPTGSFQGMVKLSDQSIHTGIYVHIEGTSYVSVTNQDGRYVISDVPYGTYTLKAKMDGYSVAQINSQQISIAGVVVEIPLLTINPVTDVHRTFSMAHQFSTRSDDENALINFTDIINNYSGTALAVESEYQVAFIHYTQDLFNLAKNEFNAFINKYPNSDLIPNVRYWLARSMSNLGDLRSAEKQYKVIISQSPQSTRAPLAQYKLAQIYEKISTADSAITAYQDLLSAYSGDKLAINAQYNIGSVYLSHDNYDQALTAFQSVINNYPSGLGTFSDARYQLAYTQYKKGDFTTAISSFKSFLVDYASIDRAVNAQYYIAYSYYSMEDYTQAIIEFNKLLTNYPNSDKVLSSRFYKAMSYYNDELFDLALPQFQTVVNNHAGSDLDLSAQYYLAICKFESQSFTYAQARSDFVTIVNQNPASEYAAKAQYKIGWSYYHLEDYVNAINAFQQVITTYPQSSQISGSYYWIAYSYYNQLAPDYSKAITNWEYYATTLQAANKNGGEAWYRIGRSYEKLGTPTDIDNAVTAYETVINNYPNCKNYNDAVNRRNTLLGI